MSLESLKRANKVTGTKQVIKAVERGIVRKVYVAMDADQHVTAPLLRLCEARGVEVQTVESMLQLGKACGLEVASASAAILLD